MKRRQGHQNSIEKSPTKTLLLKAGNFDWLPDDISNNIISYVVDTPKDAVHLAMTCNKFYSFFPLNKYVFLHQAFNNIIIHSEQRNCPTGMNALIFTMMDEIKDGKHYSLNEKKMQAFYCALANYFKIDKDHALMKNEFLETLIVQYGISIIDDVTYRELSNVNMTGKAQFDLRGALDIAECSLPKIKGGARLVATPLRNNFTYILTKLNEKLQSISRDHYLVEHVPLSPSDLVFRFYYFNLTPEDMKLMKQIVSAYNTRYGFNLMTDVLRSAKESGKILDQHQVLFDDQFVMEVNAYQFLRYVLPKIQSNVIEEAKKTIPAPLEQNRPVGLRQ